MILYALTVLLFIMGVMQIVIDKVKGE